MRLGEHYHVTTEGGQIILHLVLPSPDTGLPQRFTCPMTPAEATGLAVAVGTAVADLHAAEGQGEPDEGEDPAGAEGADAPKRRRRAGH